MNFDNEFTRKGQYDRRHHSLDYCRNNQSRLDNTPMVQRDRKGICRNNRVSMDRNPETVDSQHWISKDEMTYWSDKRPI